MPLDSHIGLREYATTEEERLKVLRGLDILDSDPEEEFDELVHLAREVCGTPISLVSLVDAERQWFKAAAGLGVKETHRDFSFCSHAIKQTGIFLVEDAEADSRFNTNPLVTGDPGIRFYAGIPLEGDHGALIGTLCVIDTVPRSLTENQRCALAILAKQVQSRIELSARKVELHRALMDNIRLSASLANSRSTFRAFMDRGPFVSYIKDGDGRMLFYNQAMSKQFRIDGESWIGKKDHELWPKEMAEKFREVDRTVIAELKVVEAIETTTCPLGGVSHWKSYKFPIQHESGEWMLAGISTDVTEQLRREAELEDALRTKLEAVKKLEASRELLRTFQDNSPHLGFIKSEDGRYLSYNRAFADFFGIDGTSWIGVRDCDVLPAAAAKDFSDQDQQVLELVSKVDTCQHVTSPSGSNFVLRTIKFPVTGSAGEALIGGVAIDITADVARQKELEDAIAELERLARTDTLTGLYSRRVFEERMEREFALAVRRGRALTVLMIDLDDFKKRNDVFGHAAGDEALRIFGRVLRGIVKVGEVAARLGGEEFGLLLPEIDNEEAVKVAERLQFELAQIQCASGPIMVSIGVASKDSTVRTWERLVARADDVMYEAKRAGKARVITYQSRIEKILGEARERSSGRWRVKQDGSSERKD